MRMKGTEGEGEGLRNADEGGGREGGYEEVEFQFVVGCT